MVPVQLGEACVVKRDDLYRGTAGYVSVLHPQLQIAGRATPIELEADGNSE